MIIFLSFFPLVPCLLGQCLMLRKEIEELKEQLGMTEPGQGSDGNRARGRA